MKILPFILICLFFSPIQAGHNLASIRFNMENLNMLRLQKELLHSLCVLLQKLKEDKFKGHDMLLLQIYAYFVHQIGDILNKQRIEEGPVYWYSRKGRKNFIILQENIIQTFQYKLYYFLYLYL